MFNEIFGENVGFVAKLNVSDLDKSVDWYADKVGLVPDPRFDVNGWAQLNIPGVPQVAVGLYTGTPPGTGGSVPTFVVDDINAVRERLLDRGVTVTPVDSVGDGVEMASFHDLDGNELGLRQNPPTQPGAHRIGAR